MSDKRKVRLLMGEGADRVDIGTAEIETQEDGTTLITGVVTDDPEVTKKLSLAWTRPQNPLFKSETFSIGEDVE